MPLKNAENSVGLSQYYLPQCLHVRNSAGAWEAQENVRHGRIDLCFQMFHTIGILANMDEA
jgi:hypothetical protein